ncbi:hypothetical protein APTSU1_001666000 [Apodemus speciosus]|uniref:N-terminal Ras-GEF domain-containing protein n=1 Tax=Apodemus speciosus TaxID=105296 RepID=A0ABQ0FQ98_APOSI
MTPRGSDLKKDRSEGHEEAWRYLVLSCLQCFWPFGQEETDLTQDSQAQDHADKDVNECAPKDMKKPCRESCISTDVVEKLVNHLVPSLQGSGDPFYVPAFLYSYRRFTTTQHVLDLLFKRYAYFRPDCKEDEKIKSILYSFLDMWIDKYPEEFCKTSDLSILKKLQTYLIMNMPYSDLTLRVHMLLMELQQESSESEREDEVVSDLGSHTSGDSEIEVWFPPVKLQPEPACAQETENPKSTRML